MANLPNHTGSRGTGQDPEEGQLRIRTSIAAVVAVVSSLGLLAPAANAAGSACASVYVAVNGGEVVNQTVCQELP